MEKDKKQLIVATNSLHKFICHVEILGVHVFQHCSIYGKSGNTLKCTNFNIM